ncbi:hypothetical protein [Stackebrandtia albiflava]|nr:hypothetical protein [Stackebrandtia albiflava]
MTTVAFIDETTAGARSDAWHLEIFEERLSLGELLRRRVFQEVAEYNAKQPEVFTGLVRPTDAEVAINGFRMRERRRVDPEKQYELAVESFGRNGFVVLVDDRQIEELDAEIEIRQGTEITFLKLVPLVGG